MKPLVARPVPKEFPISSDFGMRIHPITKAEKFHNGIDFACPEGTEVRPVLDGTIKRVGYENEGNHKQGFGLRVWQEVIIKEEYFLVVYAHLSETLVQEGDFMGQHSPIGKSGQTGSSSGPHLHIGMKADDTPTYLDMEFEDANKKEQPKDV